MRLTAIIIIALVTLPMLHAQEETLSKKEQRQLAKEKRKAKQAAQDEKDRELTKLMLEYQRFVLEADYIANRTGARKPVSSNLNFIIVDSTEATLQLGSPWGMGINGVGGITVEGNVTKFEVNEIEKKKGNTYSVTMFIMTSLGTYDITMWVSPTGRADATVRGNTSGQLTYSGELVPLSVSEVYKATAIP